MASDDTTPRIPPTQLAALRRKHQVQRQLQDDVVRALRGSVAWRMGPEYAILALTDELVRTRHDMRVVATELAVALVRLAELEGR